MRPLPVPLELSRIEIHVELAVTDHWHPSMVVTSTTPRPPLAPNRSVVGEMLY
jgi:hypothetical protein